MKQTRARFQRGSLTKFKRDSGREVWIFRWREIQPDGSRRPRKLVVGSVGDLPTERSAWLAVQALHLDINSDLSDEVRRPKTVQDLIEHYRSSELSDKGEHLAYSTKENYKAYLKNWIEPKWGELLLSDLENLPGVYVEHWLKTVPRTLGTRAKLRNLLSALCSHAMRYGWFKNHPIIGKVRQSAKATRIQVPLEVEQLQALYQVLTLVYRLMLLLDVPTGMRCGELFALQWRDFDFSKKTMTIFKSIWHQHVGPVKTEESERVMPIDDEMIVDLLAWRSKTKYAKDTDWVFASSMMKGKQPLWPEGVMKNHIRPAAKLAGITQRVTWHTFRHTFTNLLLENEEDVKTVQSLLRHANPNITMGIYAHAVDRKKRSAQSKVVQMVLPKAMGPKAEEEEGVTA